MSGSLFGDTVTAYRRDGSAWARTVLNGVQWRAKTERTNDGGRNTLKNIVSVTIPESLGEAAKTLTDDGNTVLVLGVGAPIGTDYPITQLRKDNKTYCTVRSIADNTLRPRLKHWRVIAE